jgi:hypothetical protein
VTGRDSIIRPRRRRVVRLLLTTGAATGGLAVAIAVLHTRYGRPVRERVAGQLRIAPCPAKKVSAEVAEGLRLQALALLRGDRRAAARPALGFALDASREADVVEWARSRRVDCAAKAAPTRMLTCANVPAAAFPWGAREGVVDEVTFAFAPDGGLIGVHCFRRALTAVAAARLFGQIEEDLASRLGKGGERVGESTVAHLDAGPMQVARLRYRFSDYFVAVTAMNLTGRVALREQYTSARTGS